MINQKSYAASFFETRDNIFETSISSSSSLGSKEPWKLQFPGRATRDIKRTIFPYHAECGRPE